MIVRVDEQWIKKAFELYEKQCAITKMKDEEKMIAEELKVLSEGEDSKGGGYEFKCIKKKGNIRYSTIPELKLLDLEKYRGNDVSYWKLYKKW